MKTIYKVSAVLCFLFLAASYLNNISGQFSPISNEIRANTTISGYQSAYWWSLRTVAVQPDGGFIVVWIDYGGADGQAKGIFGQRFDASGAKVGAEFQVNSTTSGDQDSPSIAVAPDGSFLISWYGPGLNGTDIFAQRYSKDGVKVRSEFLLNVTVSGNQAYPEIQFYPDGTYIAGFVDGAQTVLQKFDENDRSVGVETRISSGTGNVVIDGLCIRPDNSILLFWTSGGDVYGQLFDANIQPIGSQTRLNTYVTGTQQYCLARVDAQGNFVAVWESAGQDGSGNGVYGKRFDKNFNALGAEFCLTTNTTNDQFGPTIAMSPNGRFIVGWTDNNNRDGGGGSTDLAGPGASVWIKEYDANGNAVGAEAMVNQSINGYQGYPLIDMNASGRLVVFYEGNGTQTGQVDNFGVYSRCYQLSQTGTTLLSVSPTNVTAGDIVTVTMTLSALSSLNNVFANPLSVSGTNGVFATLISGPSPSTLTVGVVPVTVTWTYRVTALAQAGTLTFAGNACNPTGVIFPYTTSNTVSVNAALYISDLTASSLIDDSNNPLSGPRAFTIGTKVTNLSLNALTNIQINVGDGITPGTFPVTTVTLAQTNNKYQGSFSLYPLAGAGDCIRGIGTLGAAKRVINGSIDFNGDGFITSSDDGILSNGKIVIDGRVDVNKDGFVNTSDDLSRPPGLFDGYRDPSIIDGYVDVSNDGVINASDASTYGGETVNVYWFVRYDVVDASNNPTFGDCNDFADDLQYKWVVWATGSDAGINRSAQYSDYARVRCEISAASNKVQPSGSYISSFPNRVIAGQIDVNSDGIISGADDGSFYFAGVIDGKWDVDKSGTINTADDAVIANTYNVIDGYIDLTKDGIINSNDNGLLVGVGQTFSITFNNVSFGTIGSGFDANRDNLWDLDLWYQPVGGTTFAWASFRLVDIQSDLVGTGGNNPLNGITTHYDNEPYLSRLFDDRLGQSGGFNGSYTYTFQVMSMGTTILTPYQQAASGTNNEKYSNDFPSVGVNIFTMPVALAVNGLEASVKLTNGNSAKIDWKTKTESNSDYFVVERSIDGSNFSVISNHIKATGNSSVTRYYQYTDDIGSITQAKIYYRVKEFDITGKQTISNIVIVTLKKGITISIWPNPVTSSTTVNINSTVATKMMFKITNAAGATIRSFNQPIEKGVNQVVIDNLERLSPGMYLVEIIDINTGIWSSQKIIRK